AIVALDLGDIGTLLYANIVVRTDLCSEGVPNADDKAKVQIRPDRGALQIWVHSGKRAGHRRDLHDTILAGGGTARKPARRRPRPDDGAAARRPQRRHLWLHVSRKKRIQLPCMMPRMSASA